MNARGVDLTTCDREPIHVPGAIQPFGALIAVDAEARLVFRSRNAPALLPDLPALGAPLAAPYRELVQTLLTARDVPVELSPLELRVGRQLFDVVAHRSADTLVLELEPRHADAPQLMSFALQAQRGLERIQRHHSLDALLDVATEELWTLTGFDRVMAYRFLHDDSGHVVAERSRPGLETFLGLRYPATDIPVQARRLFALNRLRFIPDLSYQPVPIEPECGPDTSRPLDLSHSALRSVSPVHVEYLQNMGVTGSMSISIVVGGRLWGLFACHHYNGPRLVPHAVRVSCALLAQIVSLLVERAELEESTRAQEQARVVRESLVTSSRAAEDMVAGLVGRPSFVDLIEAVGGAVLWDKRVVLQGRTPPADVVASVADHLRDSATDIVATQTLGLELPQLAARLDGIAGMLAVRIHPEHGGYIVWFRPDEAQTVRWAGSPEKTYSEGPLGTRLNPRGSFREWRETVRGRAAPFRPFELAVASAFRRDMQEVALSKLSELERARDLMLAALGHDLRTPLSAISMAASLLSVDARAPAELGARITRSSDRMQRLVEQMLDFSRIQSGMGLGVSRRAADLALLLQHSLDEARTGFPGTELRVDAPSQLLAYIDPDRIAQVISNLLSNARHHGKLGAAIRIELGVEGELAVLSVTNEGDPIPAATRAQIFQPFKSESLRRTRNRSGLGLGLHIVHEIVKSHGGSIEIVDGEGLVTFRIRLPLS